MLSEPCESAMQPANIESEQCRVFSRNRLLVMPPGILTLRSAMLMSCHYDYDGECHMDAIQGWYGYCIAWILCMSTT